MDCPCASLAGTNFAFSISVLQTFLLVDSPSVGQWMWQLVGLPAASIIRRIWLEPPANLPKSSNGMVPCGSQPAPPPSGIAGVAPASFAGSRPQLPARSSAQACNAPTGASSDPVSIRTGSSSPLPTAMAVKGPAAVLSAVRSYAGGPGGVPGAGGPRAAIVTGPKLK